MPTAREEAADDEGQGVGTRWAVLVAGSSGYGNYRHQVMLCFISCSFFFHMEKFSASKSFRFLLEESSIGITCSSFLGVELKFKLSERDTRPCCVAFKWWMEIFCSLWISPH